MPVRHACKELSAEYRARPGAEQALQLGALVRRFHGVH